MRYDKFKKLKNLTIYYYIQQKINMKNKTKININIFKKYKK